MMGAKPVGPRPDARGPHEKYLGSRPRRRLAARPPRRRPSSCAGVDREACPDWTGGCWSGWTARGRACAACAGARRPAGRPGSGGRRVGMGGWRACGARGAAGIRCGRCRTPSTRRTAGRGGRSGRAVPLEGADTVPQRPRPEPAPLRASAKAGSAAAEREPPAGRPAGCAADGGPGARCGGRAAGAPRRLAEPASNPSARTDVRALPQWPRGV